MNRTARLVVENIRSLRALIRRWGANPGPLSMRDIRRSYRVWREVHDRSRLRLN